MLVVEVEVVTGVEGAVLAGIFEEGARTTVVTPSADGEYVSNAAKRAIWQRTAGQSPQLEEIKNLSLRRISPNFEGFSFFHYKDKSSNKNWKHHKKYKFEIIRVRPSLELL